MAWIERHWYRITLLHALLYPLSLVFRAAVALRRSLYRAGILPVAKLPVPVVVVGNISVGGTGKTPIVLWLADFLLGRGRRPGIVGRGYGGKSGAPQPVTTASDPAVCGDEMVLLAQRCNAPVWIGSDRTAAARALLAAHPGCDVIVSDDGLQHYGLARDIEIAVIDGARGFGNGFMLPAGPLRESPARLASVDTVIVNTTAHEAALKLDARAVFTMSLQGSTFHNLLNPEHQSGPEPFRGRTVHAVAGIGNPGRFFEHLQRLGITFTAHPFPDHHAFSAADVACAGADFIVMTEKDAVKCRQFATENYWVLRVDAEVDPAFGELVWRKVREHS